MLCFFRMCVLCSAAENDLCMQNTSIDMNYSIIIYDLEHHCTFQTQQGCTTPIVDAPFPVALL